MSRELLPPVLFSPLEREIGRGFTLDELLLVNAFLGRVAGLLALSKAEFDYRKDVVMERKREGRL